MHRRIAGTQRNCYRQPSAFRRTRCSRATYRSPPTVQGSPFPLPPKVVPGAERHHNQQCRHREDLELGQRYCRHELPHFNGSSIFNVSKSIILKSIPSMAEIFTGTGPSSIPACSGLKSIPHCSHQQWPSNSDHCVSLFPHAHPATSKCDGLRTYANLRRFTGKVVIAAASR